MMKGPSAPAVAIVAGLKPKKKAMEEPEEDSEDMEMKAAEEVMAAIKSGDVASFKDALKAFMESCGGY